jgi:hypothetical protein
MLPLQVVNQVVQQEELESLIGIGNQIRHLRKLHRKQSVELLKRLLSGAKVEQGIHCAEIEEQYAGGARISRLVLY